MKVLLRSAHINDPNSPYNGKIKDVFIESGIIQKIDDAIDIKADKVIDIPGLHISPGWVDIFSNFNDPGYEFRETLETGANAAAAGGYTEVLIIPDTNPSIYTKSQVEYVVQKSKSLPVNIHPIGAATKKLEGKELAEMYDMHASGAIAFSDGLNPVQSAGLLLKALEYVKAFNGTIIQIPEDKSIHPFGLINEGIISTRLGLPGKPHMAEEIMVARDIKLARYTESKLHFTGISSKKSLEYIQRAKEGGIQVTCSVTPYHLYFIDEDLQSYDTNLKVTPPLRTNDDRLALQNALCNGIIDCVASHHLPQHWDAKTCEFEYAKPGMIGLESCFGVIGSVMNNNTTDNAWSIDKWINCACILPRKIFNLQQPIIKENEKVNCTLFDPAASYTFDVTMIRSRSKNSPFIGKELKGKAIGIIRDDKMFLN